MVNHKCLLARSDEGSEGLEKFLRDNLDSLSGERLERIVKVDPSGVLEFLDENLVGLGDSKSEVVRDDEEMSISGVDRILSSELIENSIDGANNRQL